MMESYSLMKSSAQKGTLVRLQFFDIFIELMDTFLQLSSEKYLAPVHEGGWIGTTEEHDSWEDVEQCG